MKKIFIVHYNPLELYPPVQNLLNFIGEQQADRRVIVVTTSTFNKTLSTFQSPNENIQIIRLGKTGPGTKALPRYFQFIHFYVGCLWYMIVKSPAIALYFETLSSFPVIAYRKIFKHRLKIFIHYHEYTSKEEYAGGTRLLKFFHNLEKKIYPYAAWVSHTNAYRMAHFEKDILPVIVKHKKILPNYPPLSWKAPAKFNIEMPVKIVYVGALSMHTMFTQAFAGWVIQQEGRVTWDIYSYNIKENARSFFSALQTEFIQLKEGMDYDQLPHVLKKYDVGVVLYNGHIANYVFNAPNKLFEYIACGLDVWFPSVMTGSLNYTTTGSYPKVMAVDFTSLQDFNLRAAIDRENHTIQQHSFFSEYVLGELYHKLSD